MNYTIYIQALNNFPIADWAVSAYMGFREKQANIVFFEDINEVPVSSTNIVVAFIEDTNKYFEKLGLPRKRALNIPEKLEGWAKRRITRATMKDLREKKINFPIFVKPDRYAKEFVAGVVKDQKSVDFYFKDIKDDCPILLSQVVEFTTEWRVYVINGEIKGIKHYIGDFFEMPDQKIIRDTVKHYQEIGAPSAYGIDFGVCYTGKTSEVGMGHMRHKETQLIEINDGWSLGNYGLNDVTYSTLLATRWRELMKDVPKDTKRYYYGAAHEHVPNPRRR